jgi:hypothetical protein
MEIRCQETTYGFNYGAAEITRLFSDKKTGSITLALKTPKGELQIYVTRTGKVRIFDYHGKAKEWQGTLTLLEGKVKGERA